MRAMFVIVALAACPPCSHATEPFCDTRRAHPIDARLERLLDQTQGVTPEFRDVQGKALKSWEQGLNRVYRELTAVLPAKEKVLLHDAQQAWLSFRDKETKLVWSEGISDSGSLSSVTATSYGMTLFRVHVYQLNRYKLGATP